jgi:Flp pilus assembly secretin CpaC
MGEVPIFGNFFKGRTKNEEKSDLSVFVTPRVIKAPVMTPAENYHYSRIDAHWDLPEYFFDDSMIQRERRSSILNDSELYRTPRLNLPEAQ